MQSPLLAQLQQRRASIRARWDTLLRTEPVTSSLADPDSLVHLIDSTIEEVFSMLDAGYSPGSAMAAHAELICPCGRNPLLAYFAAARQAMQEGLVLSQAALAPFDPIQRDLSLIDLNTAITEISRREIEAFCGLCQFRGSTLAGIGNHVISASGGRSGGGDRGIPSATLLRHDERLG